MLTSRERILAALRHQTLDRIPICEDAIWPETIARWEKEGLPPGVAPIDYFGMDRIVRSVGVETSFFPHEIYEDNPDYCVDLNGEGTVVKWYKNRGSSSGHMELYHRVQTIHDWRAASRRLTVSEDRLRPAAKVPADCFTVLGAKDHFWMSFTMCGMENLCCWLILEPDEMLEIYETYTDFLIGMMDLAIKRGIAFDGVWFFSDMAYCSGPMFSMDIFRNVIAPAYIRLKQWCTKNGKWLFLHTDGNLNLLLPELVAVGFDLIQPLEARAGNDIRRIKPAYGDRTTFMGNINADILAKGDLSKIEDEIASKITVAKKGGGYIYNIDHSVPPTISFEVYRQAVAWIKKYGSY